MRVQPKQRKALAAPGIVLRFCRFCIVQGSGCLRLAVSSAVKLTGRLDSHCESMLYPRCLRCLGILHLAMLHRHRAACVSSPMPVWSTWGLFPRQDPAAEALCPRLAAWLPGRPRAQKPPSTAVYTAATQLSAISVLECTILLHCKFAFKFSHNGN